MNDEASTPPDYMSPLRNVAVPDSAGTPGDIRCTRTYALPNVVSSQNTARSASWTDVIYVRSWRLMGKG